MNNKPGRNDSCPCGSGKKYKKCCYGKEDATHSPFQSDEYTLEQRTTILYNAMGDIFCFNKAKEWKDLKKFITSDRIKHFYKVVAALWPPHTNIASILPKPDDGKLKALYIGRHEPEIILKNIMRYALYTDEILVFLPFQNPWCLKSEYNPIDNPDKFKIHMLRSMAFAQELAPWIFSGHVKLIPDPGDFDYKLRRSTWDMAIARDKAKKIITEEDFKEDYELAKKRFRSVILNTSEEYRRKIIKESRPDITEKEIEETLVRMQKTVENDPYMINETLAEAGGQFTMFSSGANLEMAMYISYLTGAYLYTDWKPRWRELLSVQDNTENSALWTPLASAFQNLDFKFLNNVSSKFACSLRGDGRLESFRIFLRKTWVEISKEESEIANRSTIARSFTDELKDEYQKAQVDWNDIDKNLISKMGIGGVMTSAAGMISGGMNWQIPAGGFALSGIVSLLLNRFDRSRFRAKCPMSVLIDLKDKQNSR